MRRYWSEEVKQAVEDARPECLAEMTKTGEIAESTFKRLGISVAVLRNGDCLQLCILYIYLNFLDMKRLSSHRAALASHPIQRPIYRRAALVHPFYFLNLSLMELKDSARPATRLGSCVPTLAMVLYFRPTHEI